MPRCFDFPHRLPERKTQWLLAHCSTRWLHSSPMCATDVPLKDDHRAINTTRQDSDGAEHANASKRLSEGMLIQFQSHRPIFFFSFFFALHLFQRRFGGEKNTSFNHSSFTLCARYAESSLNYWGRRFIWLSVFECDNFTLMSFWKKKKPALSGFACIMSPIKQHFCSHQTDNTNETHKSSGEKPQMSHVEQGRAFAGRRADERKQSRRMHWKRLAALHHLNVFLSLSNSHLLSHKG